MEIISKLRPVALIGMERERKAHGAWKWAARRLIPVRTCSDWPRNLGHHKMEVMTTCKNYLHRNLSLLPGTQRPALSGVFCLFV